MDTRHEPSRVNLPDLPEDILHEILGYFTTRKSFHFRGSSETWALWRNCRLNRDDEDWKTVQALRLVCRAFCQVATPFLVPVLRVGINSESLNRADQLTKNSLIAAGVRCVLVSLAYRPKEMAEDAVGYRDGQIKVIESLVGRCQYQVGSSGIPEHCRRGEALDITLAVRTYGRMLDAWRDWPGGVSGNAEGFYSKALLSQWHEEYRRRYQDQERLLNGGLFATTLAAYLSRIPPESLRALVLQDDPDRPVEYFYSRQTLHILANDVDKLRRVMIAAHSLKFLENLDPKPEIRSVKLLWELPMAIHAAGNHRLRGLFISPFITKSNFDKLCPSGENDWEPLKAAFQTLETVQVDTGYGGIKQRKLISSKNRGYLINYLSALLSGPRLEAINLAFFGLRPTPGRISNNRDRNIRIGSVLTRARCQNVKRLGLRWVSLSEEDLVALFSGLGNKLQLVDLYGVGVLEGGGWTRPLDVLRDKVMRSPRGSRAKLTSLYGGGFDVHAQERFDDGYSDDETSDEDDSIYKAAERYATGEEAVNPVAAFEMQNRI